MESQPPRHTGQGDMRRVSEPYEQTHRYQHRQPQYADYRPRRNTDGGPLRKMHSRPEDYKNKPRTGNMVEYICFNESDHPQEHDESASRQQTKVDEVTKTPLDRHESNASNRTSSTVLSDDSGYDSEDELSLPPMYHHDVASRDDEADRWGGYRHEACGNHTIEGYHSPERPPRHDSHKGQREDKEYAAPHRRAHDHHDHYTNRRTSNSSYDSPSPRSHSHTRKHSSSSERSSNEELIAQVAQHLQSHKNAYGHRNTKQLVGELLCEVVRKVKDGSLDDSTMREVVREVQHVL